MNNVKDDKLSGLLKQHNG